MGLTDDARDGGEALRNDSLASGTRRRDESGSEALETILLVEDNPGDALLVRQWLSRAGVTAELVHHETLGGALDALRHDGFDVVLLDLGLPDARGTEAIAAMRDVAPDVPLVVLTGQNDERMARAAVEAGAHDYLEKDEIGATGLRRSIALARARAAEARARAQLFHADRLQTVGQLAAGVAHEVRNPLQFVQSNLSVAFDIVTSLSSADTASEDRLREAREALSDALEGTERIRSVVAILGEFSRAEDASVATMSLAQVVEDARSMVAHRLKRSADFEVRLEPVPLVLGRRSRLVQVFVNLLLNAAQAIDSVGRKRGRVEVKVGFRAGHVEVRVGDDGCGMSARTQRRIFEPFFTTKRRGVGTGLGLAICRDIIAEHGGSLSVESELGRGTTFVLRLPPAGTPPRGVERPVTPVRAPAPLRILLVDDEPLVLRALARQLRGHEVTKAAGGAEAIEHLESGAVFDVVVCDLSMPGVDGRAVRERALALDPSFEDRFLFVTGGAVDADDRELAVATRALDKPVDAATLRARLTSIGPR